MDASRPVLWPKLTRFRGDTKQLPFILTDDLGNALDPDDHTLFFSVEGSDGTPLVQKQSTIGGFTTVDAATGSILVAMLPADDEALEDDTVYPCTVVAQHNDTGAIHRVRATLKLIDGLLDDPEITIPTNVEEPQPGFLAAEEIETNRAAAEAAAATATTQAGIATTQAGLAATAKTAAEAAQAAAAASAAAAAADEAAADVARIAAQLAETNASGSATAANVAKLAAQAAQAAAEAAQAAATASAAAALASQTASAANAASALVSQTAAAASAGAAAAVGVSLVNPYLASKATRPGIISAGTAPVGTTQDNTGLAFGTGDLTFGMWMRIADWTPSADVRLFSKFASNLGIKVIILSGGSSGTLYISLGNGTNFTTYTYSATAITGATDGTWAFLACSMDRDGNMVVYVNGTALGSPVSIAGSSAQTLTSTGALNWFNESASYTTGTLGECWIISGLLTATQIANIYAAGSIAPFCTYTANTTTGQNTATIGGLSFFQWVDFGQGYGPIIRDRSGNNQHALMGTTGLTHAVPRNPPGLPARAPRAALVNDGTNSSFVRATLNAQTIGTGDFTVFVDAAASKTQTDTSHTALAAFASSSSTYVVARSFGVKFNTATVSVLIFGATTSDDNYWICSNLATLIGTDRFALAVTRSGTTVRIYLLYRGDATDITNLGAFGSDGSAPGWDGTITATYKFVGYGKSDALFIGSIFGARLANVALTEAQLRTEYERGEPGPEWVGASWTDATPASQATKLGATDGTSTWAAIGAGGGGLTKNAVAGARTGGAGAYVMEIAANGASAFSTFGTVVPGKVGQLGYMRGWARRTVGSGVCKLNGVALPTSSSWTQFASTWTIAAAHTGAPSVAIEFTSATVGDKVELDDVEFFLLGYTARLRTDTAAGLTVINGAKSSTNDSTDFLLSTTGVTTSPDGRTQTIRAQTTTSGNQQLFGASVIDTTKKWRIRSWNITSTGTPTVSLGSASAGAQYVSGAVLTAATNEITLLTRIPTVANLWCNSSSTATLDHVIVLDLVE